MRVPDLDPLRGFVTVAERGGFTAAGWTLGLRRSAISLNTKLDARWFPDHSPPAD